MIDLPEEARLAHMVCYDLPSKVKAIPEMIDPLIRNAVLKINESGWVWTGESCQGHPDSETFCWADNARPMLRLITRSEDVGDMMRCLLTASLEKENPDLELLEQLKPPYMCNFEIYPCRQNKGWCEILVYIPATTVYHRNNGCKIFERFGELLINEW